MVVDDVEELADGPKKEDNRDVQECVCSVHEPPHRESVKALK